MIGYGTRAIGQNCDVLLYGDSTALVGLDPSVIRSKTGLTACNIAESKLVMDLVGVNYPLDEYLAHNRPPEFLITAWAPGDFDLERPPSFDYSADGYLYAFQYDRGSWLWRGMIRHPKDSLSFLVWVQGSILKHFLEKIIPGRSTESDERSLRDSRNGLWHEPVSAQDACVDFPLPPVASRAENAASVARFRQRYAGRTQHLVIDVTPIADCFQMGRESIPTLKGLSDNAPQLWPVSSFATMNIHMTPQGARRFSAQIADQINGIMQQAQHR